MYNLRTNHQSEQQEKEQTMIYFFFFLHFGIILTNKHILPHCHYCNGKKYIKIKTSITVVRNNYIIHIVCLCKLYFHYIYFEDYFS